MFDFVRQFIRIEKDAKVIDAADARKLICYRCERELGPDHDEEKCHRKGMSRRFFLGGLAATAAGAAGISAAVENGLFGEKSRQLEQKINAEKATTRFPGIRKGDILFFGEFGRSIRHVTLGAHLGNRGFMFTERLNDGKMVAPFDMDVLYSRVGYKNREISDADQGLGLMQELESAPINFVVFRGNKYHKTFGPSELSGRRESRLVTELKNRL